MLLGSVRLGGFFNVRRRNFKVRTTLPLTRVRLTAVILLVSVMAPLAGAQDVEFIANRQRALPGQVITFYDLSDVTDAATWEWNFGDTTIVTNLTADPVTHAYSSPGVYNVILTIGGGAGYFSKLKVGYIEVLNAPFVDFVYALPETLGDVLGIPLPPVVPDGAFVFVDTSVGGPGKDPAKAWSWSFGDGTPAQSGPVVAHVFNFEGQTGVFDVQLTVTWADNSTMSYTRQLILTQPGTEDQRNGGSLIIRDAIAERDRQGLLPLQDWMPLFSFEMISAAPPDATKSLGGGAMEKAFLRDPLNDRVFSSQSPLTFTISPDEDTNNGPALIQTDILEFGIFREKPTWDGGTHGVLESDEPLVLRFLPDGTVVNTVTGVPYDMREGPTYPDPSPGAGVQYVGRDRLGLRYKLWGQRSRPPAGGGLIDVYPAIQSRYYSVDDSGASYILAVRTSATWSSLQELSYYVDSYMMVDGFGLMPVDENGELIDTYDPDFDALPFDPDTTYLSQFRVDDATSGLFDDFRGESDGNAWYWPQRMYTPIQEYVRPRWDVPGGSFANAFDFVTGEWLNLRKLHSLEGWIQMVAIDVHASNPPNTLGARAKHGEWSDSGDWVAFKEINLIISDVRGDPSDPKGVNRLNPIEEFNSLTYDALIEGGNIITNLAVGNDFAFNGVWVFHDSNNNGVFDPPIPQPDGRGVTFVDYPMLPNNYIIVEDAQSSGGGTKSGEKSSSPLATGPLSGEKARDVNYYPPEWEYIPFPPGGGAPWWKVRLVMGGGSREGVDKGFVEPVPDFPDPDTHDTRYDYFVVVRPDSGYFDLSTMPGDGVGMTLGMDYRVFIEPRRFNPLVLDNGPYGSPNGSWDGGLYFDSMQMPMGRRDDSPTVDFAQNIWQNDPLWLEYEPWWPERTADRTTAKPARVGLEVHDLTLTYESNSKYATQTNMIYANGWPLWLDPFGQNDARFYKGAHVFVQADAIVTEGPADEDLAPFQHAFESAPFFQPNFDAAPIGPRSRVFPNPPAQPERPEYGTWPALLQPDEYPKLADWPAANRRARILKQHIDSSSKPTAMLGINVAGANDPVVNRFNRLQLQQITVAFWGPDFTPSDLQALDIDGVNPESGVLLYEDADSDSVFNSEFGSDAPVPLRNLMWRPEPEYVDLDGDGIADDINGDGRVDSKDRAWVLRLRPKIAWSVPNTDAGGPRYSTPLRGAMLKSDESAASAAEAAAPAVLTEEVEGKPHWAKRPVRVYKDEMKATADIASALTKAVPQAGSSGDDLFVVVRTSKSISRLEPFKAFIPMTLPSRPAHDQQAGIQFTPNNIVSPQALVKSHPEEDPIEGWYYHEMMETTISCEVVDFTGSGQSIFLDGSPVPVLGIDASTNRPDLTKAQGTEGLGGPQSFVVPGAAWTSGAFVNHYLVDSLYKSFKITGNSNNRLTLLSGEPADGSWRIVSNPTFLEQVIVEFYDEGGDGKFTILNDLLPLSLDQTISGVAIYRDNDAHPGNTNGQFDKDIDIPLTLDYPPYLIGAVGEPSTQVMFVFSTPGTDNLPKPMAQQANNRQWIQDSRGTSPTHPDSGADFFIVLRSSERMDLGDKFRVAIVGWGPNTPTEPDPDTFPPPPAADRGEFDLFSEFPWGARALGFITVFNEPDYPNSGMPTLGVPDNSGFNFIRFQANKAVRTAVITASERVIGPTDVVIRAVSTDRLPQVVPSSGLSFVIFGSGFGTSPRVTLAGIPLVVTSAKDKEIAVTIPGGSVIDEDPIVLTVLNPLTGKQTSRGDLFTLISVPPDANAPVITSLSPDAGGSGDFPVAIYGQNFDDPIVYFGQTVMPVASWTPTRINVSFPGAGLGQTGTLDVTVRNQTTQLSTTKLDAFIYRNLPQAPRACFLATAAYGSDSAHELWVLRRFRDEVLLQTTLGTAFVDLYYRVSPRIAATVAPRPALAALVRGALTPLSYAVTSPGEAMGAALLFAMGVYAARRCARARSQRGHN